MLGNNYETNKYKRKNPTNINRKKDVYKRQVYPIHYGLFTIVPVEAIVGVLEGVVTVIVMKALYKAKPELVPVMSN